MGGYRYVKKLPKGTRVQFLRARRYYYLFDGMYGQLADLRVPYRRWYANAAVVSYADEHSPEMQDRAATFEEFPGPWTTDYLPATAEKPEKLIE